MQRKARLSANPFRRGAEFAVSDVGVLPVGYWQIDRTTGKTVLYLGPYSVLGNSFAVDVSRNRRASSDCDRNRSLQRATGLSFCGYLRLLAAFRLLDIPHRQRRYGEAR